MSQMPLFEAGSGAKNIVFVTHGVFITNDVMIMLITEAPERGTNSGRHIDDLKDSLRKHNITDFRVFRSQDELPIVSCALPLMIYKGLSYILTDTT